MFRNKPSVTALLSAIRQQGLTVKPASLRRTASEQAKIDAWPTEDAKELHWLKRTPFETAAVFAFDTPTFDWLDRLRNSAEAPDWHRITIDPDTSPLLDVEDWVLAAQNKTEALGWTLAAMDGVRAEPIAASVGGDGSIVIEGHRGPIVKIEPMVFARASPDLTRRVERRLRGLRVEAATDYYAQRLSKIQGFENFRAGPHEKPEPPALTDYDSRQPLHITSANLCTALQSAIQPHVKEKISRSTCQEILAAYLGFDSWQHLRAREKTAGNWLDIPIRVSEVTIDENDEQHDHRIHAYRSLPEGLAALSQLLKISPARNLDVCNSWSSFHIDSIERRPFDKPGNVQTLYYPGSYVACSQFALAICEWDDYRELADTLLKSPALGVDLRRLFATGSKLQDRAVLIDSRAGVLPEDHIQLGPWHFSVNRGKIKSPHPVPSLTVEWMGDGVGELEYGTRWSSTLHKTSFIEGEDGAVWLADNWDRKAKLRLDGITRADAREIEERFLNSDLHRTR